MKLLDAYLLRRYLLCLGASVLSLWLIAVVVDLTENVDTFIDHQARLGLICLYYLYRTPYWIVLGLPVTALLATLFSLTSLARHREIMAAKAAGLSLYRLLLPLFLLALLLSGLAFLFTDRVVPAATYRYHAVRDEIRSYRRSDGSRRQVLLQDAGGQIVFARSYDAHSRTAHEVLWEREQDSAAAERITAQRLEWHDGRWVMVAGHRYLFAGAGPQVIAFDTLEVPSLSLQPDDFASQQKKPEEMNYGELRAYIDRARANGEDATRNLVDLYLKVSFPFTCLVIVLLGAPLAANARHASLANSFGMGILICFAYYGGVKAGQALGWNKLVSPLLGAWLANIVFGMLGGFLLWRAHK